MYPECETNRERGQISLKNEKTHSHVVFISIVKRSIISYTCVSIVRTINKILHNIVFSSKNDMKCDFVHRNIPEQRNAIIK